MEYLILEAVLGIGRIIETTELKHDPFLAGRIRLKKLPHPATGHRALDRFVAQLEGVHQGTPAVGRGHPGHRRHRGGGPRSPGGRMRGLQPALTWQACLPPFVAFEGQSRALL
ncbi:hypothetical protein [Limnochorda pilosa]|uniref:hypothetical protein n=1 Tax=Limnochorda pilosa TaxID=1555112 RepID=UPI0011876D88|nr:hypothetical protein [Limnochorda pilosa]